MSIYVHPIATDRDQLSQYVQFPIDLYRDNSCYVPPLIIDRIATLDPDSNPASDFCESQSFMAFDNGEPVGTITAIINRASNAKTGPKQMRFGFMDFIDNAEVVDALFDAVTEWGKERGMTEMVGPVGFTDLDPEGMLIEGFDEMGTMATIYNYPYYVDHMKRLGFEKEVDWIEFRIAVPDSIPEKFQRIGEIVAKKYNLRVLKFTSRDKIRKEYGHAIFDLVNEAYADLYGFVSLTDRQIEHYINVYIGVLRLDDVTLVVDQDDKLVALGIAMPSMSGSPSQEPRQTFPLRLVPPVTRNQGSHRRGRPAPCGRKTRIPSKGVNAIIFNDLIPRFNANGYKFAESNVELEGNESVQKQWEYYEHRQHRRRRAWKKEL